MKQTHENSDPIPHHKESYTCAMHPEVRREQPGNCPKCGMVLEKVVDSAPESRT